ncbi:MAG: hypothetical protein HY700_05075 [Gemmatimonadetes bacterium]|nr:hypothetical protein [Gemmatimonadota bacterium]
MNPFQPLINLLALLSTLSIAAERLTNLLKLRDETLREARPSASEEKERERRIGRRALAVSVLLALAIKADFFQILAHLNAPWETLGWVRPGPSGSPALPVLSAPRLLYQVVGSLLTGISMGFGSKFWHDVLDIVYHTRRRIHGLASSGTERQINGRDDRP